MAKNHENRSLFLYTALIFLVAILMIIIAFFGQNNLQKNQPMQSETASSTSITEKAAILSEENLMLLEQNKNYLAENDELKAANEACTAENDSLKKEIENQNKLLEIYQRLYKNKKAEARELLSQLVPEELTETQKSFYDILVKKSQ